MNESPCLLRSVDIVSPSRTVMSVPLAMVTDRD
jgi:hypothetical protein